MLARIDALEKECGNPGFWTSDKKDSIFQELRSLKSQLTPYQELKTHTAELEGLLGITEETDEHSMKHLREEADALLQKLAALEFQKLLSGPNDKNSAILSINAGAGGTESCDWASMLLRMYNRWAGNRGYKVQMIDLLPGEEAGVKNVTVLIEGSFAYGYLKSEKGVHRLVRISPFDSNKRRHTSFASVDIIPEVEENVQVDIKESDLRIDVYRAGGHGGQGVNTTDSAVRITHLPTGIVVQCQNERSQLKNKATALKVLKSRLHELEATKREAAAQKSYQDKEEIAWGSQIRSYVLHPYNMVKDHRTEQETGDAFGVLEGNLTEFLEAYLKKLGERAL